MSTTWSGFTEDDIKNLTPNESLEVKPKHIPTIKSRKRIFKNITNIKNHQLKNSGQVHPISEDAKLGKVEEVPHSLDTFTEHDTCQSMESDTNEIENLELKRENNSVVLETCKIEKKVIDLDEFQARQKRIEEQNRRRKELLAKALADRTKQTEEEAKRLKEIQDEFKKLDLLLSNDVSILRHQIELASLDFMEAQKRYNKIEREFLEAKLYLHQKLEKKEMLTEHLCAIIEKNEERKAEKLKDLMSRLSIESKVIPENSENIIKEGDNSSKNETNGSNKY